MEVRVGGRDSYTSWCGIFLDNLTTNTSENFSSPTVIGEEIMAVYS